MIWASFGSSIEEIATFSGGRWGNKKTPAIRDLICSNYAGLSASEVYGSLPLCLWKCLLRKPLANSLFYRCPYKLWHKSDERFEAGIIQTYNTNKPAKQQSYPPISSAITLCQLQFWNSIITMVRYSNIPNGIILAFPLNTFIPECIL